MKRSLLVLAFALSLSAPALAATCTPFASAPWPASNGGSCQFENVSVGAGARTWLSSDFNPVDSISPYDDGTYFGVSLHYNSFNFMYPDYNEIRSSWGAAPKTGYVLKGVKIISDGRFEGLFPYDTPVHNDGGGRVTTGTFDDMIYPSLLQFVVRGTGVDGYQYNDSSGGTTTIAFSVAPVPLPAAWLLLASVLGLGGLVRRWRLA